MTYLFDRHRRKLAVFVLAAAFILVLISSAGVWAQDGDRMPTIKLPDIKIGEKEGAEGYEYSKMLHFIFALTILSLAPYLLIMCTSFIRVSIVLSFIKTALGTQQVPPTQVMMGLALFVTFYIMAPVGDAIRKEAIIPLYKNEISMDKASAKAIVPLRDFLLKQTRDKDLLLFVKLARKKPEQFQNRRELPLYIIMPAFIVSEVKTAFQIGFIIYLPFLVIDMVVASVLMSMGMFMLSPMQISMPFKLLMFVMIDGWNLIIENLVKSFRM